MPTVLNLKKEFSKEKSEQSIDGENNYIFKKEVRSKALRQP
jgi:hypothetical protein